MLYSVKETLCAARHWSHVHDATRSSRNIHVSGQLVKSCCKKTNRELWEWEVELRKRTLVMLIESSLCFWSLISVALCVFLSHLFKDTKPCESTKCKCTHTQMHVNTLYCHKHTFSFDFGPHLFYQPSSHNLTSSLLSALLIHSIYLLFIKRNRAWSQPHTCRTACSFFKMISIIYAMQQRTDCLNNSGCKYWKIL